MLRNRDGKARPARVVLARRAALLVLAARAARRALATRAARIVVAALACVVATAAPARARELTVSAAASLTAAFAEIGHAFEKSSPGMTVRTNFAGSSTLVRQILEGAPVDVFASADEANMQKLVDADAVEGRPETFARNRLTILVQRGNPKGIAGVADLARPDVVVALCAPEVPAGRYAREIFARAGVALPATSQELDVRAVVTRVALGEADAGIVYATDARAAGETVAEVAIPDAQNVIARYPVAVLRDAKHPDEGRAFVRFLLGEQAQGILARHGFLPP
ncbi:MAG TPA: molybdate ABC transporter substrate-binding protein [Candidatus Binatia bacterium]